MATIGSARRTTVKLNGRFGGAMSFQPGGSDLYYDGAGALYLIDVDPSVSFNFSVRLGSVPNYGLGAANKIAVVDMDFLTRKVGVTTVQTLYAIGTYGANNHALLSISDTNGRAKAVTHSTLNAIGTVTGFGIDPRTGEAYIIGDNAIWRTSLNTARVTRVGTTANFSLTLPEGVDTSTIVFNALAFDPETGSAYSSFNSDVDRFVVTVDTGRGTAEQLGSVKGFDVRNLVITGLSFHPENKQLYGYDYNFGFLYTVQYRPEDVTIEASSQHGINFRGNPRLPGDIQFAASKRYGTDFRGNPLVSTNVSFEASAQHGIDFRGIAKVARDLTFESHSLHPMFFRGNPTISSTVHLEPTQSILIREYDDTEFRLLEIDRLAQFEATVKVARGFRIGIIDPESNYALSVTSTPPGRSINRSGDAEYVVVPNNTGKDKFKIFLNGSNAGRMFIGNNLVTTTGTFLPEIRNQPDPLVGNQTWRDEDSLTYELDDVIHHLRRWHNYRSQRYEDSFGRIQYRRELVSTVYRIERWRRNVSDLTYIDVRTINQSGWVGGIRYQLGVIHPNGLLYCADSRGDVISVGLGTNGVGFQRTVIRGAGLGSRASFDVVRSTGAMYAVTSGGSLYHLGEPKIVTFESSSKHTVDLIGDPVISSGIAFAASSMYDANFRGDPIVHFDVSFDANSQHAINFRGNPTVTGLDPVRDGNAIELDTIFKNARGYTYQIDPDDTHDLVASALREQTLYVLPLEKRVGANQITVTGHTVGGSASAVLNIDVDPTAHRPTREKYEESQIFSEDFPTVLGTTSVIVLPIYDYVSKAASIEVSDYATDDNVDDVRLIVLSPPPGEKPVDVTVTTAGGQKFTKQILLRRGGLRGIYPDGIPKQTLAVGQSVTLLMRRYFRNPVDRVSVYADPYYVECRVDGANIVLTGVRPTENLPVRIEYYVDPVVNVWENPISDSVTMMVDVTGEADDGMAPILDSQIVSGRTLGTAHSWEDVILTDEDGNETSSPGAFFNFYANSGFRSMQVLPGDNSELEFRILDSGLLEDSYTMERERAFFLQGIQARRTAFAARLQRGFAYNVRIRAYTGRNFTGPYVDSAQFRVAYQR